MLQAATHQNQAEGVEKFFAQFEGQFLIGGDFNGHHHSWGNSKNCTTVNDLFHCNTELERNIMFLNDGFQPCISDATGPKHHKGTYWTAFMEKFKIKNHGSKNV
jgi:hypothetical protein